ncbi:L-threonylcarbamoyladenylate synthase [Heyndrickxia sporothermodurans]
MKTIQWFVDNDVDTFSSHPQLKEVAKLLQENEVVAFPTETVYGLGANAKSNAAVAKIYEAKGRPSDNPLIVHIAETGQLEELVEDLSETAKKLIDHFWPGPLTIILKRKPNVLSEKVTAGLETVAIRMPDHPVALEIIRKAQLPIAAPSANSSGKPSPTTATHVLEDLNGRIAGVVNGGETGVGVESTVVDCTQEKPMILRPGGVTKEELETVVGEVFIDPALENDKISRPKSPGMKYTHYAPNAPVYLVDGTTAFIQELIANKQEKGLRVGVIATKETENAYQADVVSICGQRSDLKTVAHTLYDTLREFNNKDVDIIFSEVFPQEGIGLAIMNRLEKAAGHRWIHQH